MLNFIGILEELSILNWVNFGDILIDLMPHVLNFSTVQQIDVDICFHTDDWLKCFWIDYEIFMVGC